MKPSDCKINETAHAIFNFVRIRALLVKFCEYLCYSMHTWTTAIVLLADNEVPTVKSLLCIFYVISQALTNYFFFYNSIDKLLIYKVYVSCFSRFLFDQELVCGR
jgi:hypothetical protein